MSRRKPSKRLLVHSDDDDEAPYTLPGTKRARTADTDASLSVASDDDNDMDVDVETSLGATDDSRFLPEDTQRKASKRRRKSPLTVKKPQVVHYDDGESDSRIAPDYVQDDLSDLSDDDDIELDAPPKRGAPKAKAATKDKAGKAKPGQPRGAKAKEKDKDILMKDERRLAAPPATTSRASSTAAQSQPSDLFSNDDLVPSSAVDPHPDALQPVKDPLSQSIPKKRKLPPIKKTKAATSTANNSTNTITTQKPPPPPAQDVTKPLPTSEQRKQALTGVRDIDLADSKIYAELFKGAGGNTPKSGLKNAEERRKELDKMRDEARARRAEDAKFTFDLQRQGDKIARFEQRLRVENSTVLHPNFLAAKLRDEWELDRRNRRASPKEEGEA